MNADERQAIRDRAADAYAPHHTVIILPNGWPEPRRNALQGLSPTEKRKYYRNRARAARRAAAS